MVGLRAASLTSSRRFGILRYKEIVSHRTNGVKEVMEDDFDLPAAVVTHVAMV